VSDICNNNLVTRCWAVVKFAPRPPYPGDRAPGTYWIEDCVGTKAEMDAKETADSSAAHYTTSSCID
jgi:hypothetical protein